MFDQAALQELLAFRSEAAQVLTLYLNCDLSHNSIDHIKRQARSLLRDAPSSSREDVAEIEQYLDHAFAWSHPGLAVFSCQADGFFRAYPVHVAFRNRLRLSRKPYVKPLAHVLDTYAHYGVILVDRVGARFFEFHLGELLDTGGSLGEDIRKVKDGGGSAAGRKASQGHGRHEDVQADRNLKDAADEANQFFQNKPIRRLFLGGTSETIAQFRDHLSRQLQSCYAGSFAIDKYAAEHEVRERSLTLLTEANERREAALVASLLERASQGTLAVTGLDDTLEMISAGRAETLIISDGYRTPGYKESGTSFVIANLAKSPLDNSQLREVQDVVEEAVTIALSQGTHVEVISDNPGLEDAGRIGAILRY